MSCHVCDKAWKKRPKKGFPTKIARQLLEEWHRQGHPEIADRPPSIRPND